MKAVLFYEHAIDKSMDELMEVFPKHEAFEKEFLKSGKILGIGAFSIPGEGAMAIFTDKASAEEFAKNDPFVLEGCIAKVTIKEWMDELG
jgi:uncharacterized protein YciI